MYSENTQEALDHVCRGGIDVTLRKILIRSGFELQKAEELREYFEMDRELDAVIPYPELKNIKKELSANKKYMEMLRSVSTSKRDTVYRYFRQEGMLAEKHKQDQKKVRMPYRSGRVLFRTVRDTAGI